MTIKYKINEEDFLDFQLFTASKSARINKKKRKSRIILTLWLILITLYFIFNENIPMIIYFSILSVATALFYPKYFKWRYKKHYKTFNKENFQKRFGELETLEIKDDCFFSKNKTGEGKINLSEIEKIDETKNHFFIKISTGHSLLIPKKGRTDIENIRARFKDLGMQINNNLNWKWE